MAAITASMVAELRAKTDAPMMECKKALTEADGDMAKAEEILLIVDDPNIEVPRAKLMADARFRLIGHWNSREYGNKTTQEHVGPDGGAIQLERKPVVDWQRLSPEAREAAKVVLLELKAQQEGGRDDE